MPIPAFVGAGDGVSVLTGTGTVNKTGCTQDNFLVCHVYEDQVTSEQTRSNRVNVKALNGVGSADTIYQSGLSVGNAQVGNHIIYMGRVMAAGTCSWDITVGAAGADLSARIYEFSGVSVGYNDVNVAENMNGTSNKYRQTAATSTSVTDPDVESRDEMRLAIALVATRGSVTIDAFTGETGYDWVEAVAEYSHAVGNGCTLQLQTADMTGIRLMSSAGAVTITSAPWGVVTFALIPSVIPYPPLGIDRSQFPKSKLRSATPVLY